MLPRTTRAPPTTNNNAPIVFRRLTKKARPAVAINNPNRIKSRTIFNWPSSHDCWTRATPIYLATN